MSLLAPVTPRAGGGSGGSGGSSRVASTGKAPHPAMRALALGRLGMSLTTVRAAPLRAATPLCSPAAAARRSLRVLASAANSGPNGPSGLGGSGRAADEALAAQRRRLILQSLARQHGTLAGAEAAAAAAAADVAGGQQRRGMLRRLLLSGAAAVALLAAAVWPRPAAAFQGPAGMFGGRPPVVEAVPVTMENKVGFCHVLLQSMLIAARRGWPATKQSVQMQQGSPLSAAPTSCAVQTPLPDLSQLSPDEILTIELFKTNT